MTEWLAGNRIRGTNAERITTAGIGKEVGGWVEVGRTTWSAGSEISVTGLADKRYYMILSDTTQSGAGDHYLQFNADTNPNYSGRRSTDSETDTTAIDTAEFEANDQTGGGDVLGVSYWSNLETKEKLGVGNFVSGSTAGSTTAPYRSEFAMKWANTSTPISSYQHKANSNFSRGEVVVLGWDATDTHSTNFWEELASVDADGTSNTLSASITSKKYLCIQGYTENTTGSCVFRVGNTTLDDQTHYSARISSNGGATDPTTEIDAITGLTNNTPIFWNIFIINNPSQEKLFIWNVSRQMTAGAGVQPNRIEGGSKWDNATASIDIVGFVNTTGGSTFDSKSTMKVWGSN